MKLYFSPAACSLAAHIVIDEAELPVQLEKVDLRTHKTENGGDYYDVNPKGYVPALQLDEGGTLTENIAILNYLADHAADKLFTPAAGSIERYRLEEWLGFITTELHKSFGPLFHGAADEEAEKIKAKIDKRLAYADAQLGAKPFLMGERMSVADAYLFVILNWARKMRIDTSRFGDLNAFFARMGERPSVQKALREEDLPIPG